MTALLLGIDASKGYADFVLLDAHGHLLEPAFQLDDTFEGHARLYQVLRSLCQSYPQVTIHAAAEATGGYETNWLDELRRFQASLPLQVARLNPARVHRHAQASGARTTTDATSAYYVASYLIAHAHQVTYDQEDALAGLRAQIAFIEQLTKQRTAYVNQFEKLLYRAQPELIQYMSSGLPQWILHLVERYPTARHLARARLQRLRQIPYLSAQRAHGLIQAAKHSVASATDEATELLLRQMARQILHLSTLIKEQKQHLVQYLPPGLAQQVSLLKSFGSIGDYTAVGLLVEIESVARFATAKQMAAFFGVHPVYKQSGDGLGAMRMSKQGSSRMRRWLYLITLNGVQHNPVIAPLYERLLAEGKEKMVAVGICMHKTLRILYGLLKSGTPFDAEVERQHRGQHPQQPSGRTLVRRRRFQAFEAGAPISGRARKRRRQQQPSQGALGPVCGMELSTAAGGEERGAKSKSLVKEQAKPT